MVLRKLPPKDCPHLNPKPNPEPGNNLLEDRKSSRGAILWRDNTY